MNPARTCLESLDRRPGIREQPGSFDHQRVAHFLPRGAATGAKLRALRESTIRKKGYPCSSKGARLGRSVSESRMLQCGAPNGQNITKLDQD